MFNYVYIHSNINSHFTSCFPYHEANLPKIFVNIVIYMYLR